MGNKHPLPKNSPGRASIYHHESKGFPQWPSWLGFDVVEGAGVTSPKKRDLADAGRQKKPPLESNARNIVVMGHTNTGKSCIALQMHSNQFLPHYSKTIEDCYFVPGFKVDDGTRDLSILDTGGDQKRDPTLIDRAFHTEGIMLVYSLDQPESLEFLKRTLIPALSPVREQRFDSIPLLIVANKCDLLLRAPSPAAGGRGSDAARLSVESAPPVECDVTAELDSCRQFIRSASEGELRVFVLSQFEAAVPCLPLAVADTVLDYLQLAGQREQTLLAAGRALARDLNVGFVAVSAKTRHNVREAFGEMVRIMEHKRPGAAGSAAPAVAVSPRTTSGAAAATSAGSATASSPTAKSSPAPGLAKSGTSSDLGRPGEPKG